MTKCVVNGHVQLSLENIKRNKNGYVKLESF